MEGLERARRRAIGYLRRHGFQTFLLMGVSFVGFGGVTLNLIYLFRANLALFWENGVEVLADGAAEQLIELVLLGFLGLVLYLIFKACEKLLLESITRD